MQAARVPLFLLSVSCSAGVEDLEGLNGGRNDAGAVATFDAGVLVGPDAGAVVPIETSIFDPRAEPVFEAPAIVFEPSRDPELGEIQGPLFDLVWTGRVYVIAWIQNIRGHLFVLSSAIDPATLRATPPQILTADYERIEDAPESVAVVFHFDRVVIAASTEEELMFIELDDGGERTDKTITAWEHGRPSPLRPIVFLTRADGFYLFGDYHLYVLDRDARPTTMAPFALSVRGYPAFGGDGLLRILTGQRVPAGDDVVLLAKFNERFELTELPATVYRARETAPIFLGPQDRVSHAAVWDFEQGSQWLSLEGDEDPIQIGEPGYHSPMVVHDPSGPRLALVHPAGTYLPDNPLPDRIEVEALDYRSGERNRRRLLYDGDPGGECLEQARAAVAGERLGVAWVMGCSTRVLRFAELRGERTGN